MTPEYLAEIFAPCGNCGHIRLNHAVARGVRRHCCYGTLTFNCECKKFVEPVVVRRG